MDTSNERERVQGERMNNVKKLVAEAIIETHDELEKQRKQAMEVIGEEGGGGDIGKRRRWVRDVDKRLQLFTMLAQGEFPEVATVEPEKEKEKEKEEREKEKEGKGKESEKEKEQKEKEKDGREKGKEMIEEENGEKKDGEQDDESKLENLGEVLSQAEQFIATHYPDNQRGSRRATIQRVRHITVLSSGADLIKTATKETL